MTGFSWCPGNPAKIATSSVDTTITLWDLDVCYSLTLQLLIRQKSCKLQQLVAHDKEVYDIAYQPHSDSEFATASADGSIRTFDSRCFDECSIFYEDDDLLPIIQIAWNKDGNYLAAIQMDSPSCLIFDKR